MPIREAANRFCYESPFSGPSLLAKAASPRQCLFWSLVVLTCATGLIVQIIQTIWIHMNSLPATTFRVESPSEMQLPTPVVCIIGPFDTHHVDKISPSLLKLLQFGLVFSSEYKDQAEPSELIQAIPEYINYTTSNKISYFELVDNLTFDAYDVFSTFGCRYNSTHKKNCYETARKFYRPESVCFELESATQILENPLYLEGYTGLRLTFNSLRSRRIRDRYGDIAGTSLFLKDGGTTGKTFLIPENTYVDLSLEAVRTVVLPSWKHKCEVNNLQSYHDCKLGCMLKTMYTNFDLCACTPIELVELVPSDQPICSPVDILECIAAYQHKFQNNSRLAHAGSSEFSKCKHCKPSCEKIEYKATMSSYRGDGMVHSRVYIHFDIMQIMVIEQFYQSFGDLVGTVGGLLGFWLGGSVIALVHMLTFWLIRSEKTEAESFTHQTVREIMGTSVSLRGVQKWSRQGRKRKSTSRINVTARKQPNKKQKLDNGTSENGGNGVRAQ